MAKNGFNLWDAIFHPKKEAPDSSQNGAQTPVVKKKPEEPKKTEEQRKDEILASARAKMAKNLRTEYDQAIGLLRSIPGWKDADQLVEACRDALVQRDKAEEAERQNQALRQKKDRKLITGTKLVVAVMLALSVVVGAYCVYHVVVSVGGYASALSLIEKGEYDEADRVLQQAIDKVESNIWYREDVYAVAKRYAEIGQYQRAYNWYVTLGNYSDARLKAQTMVWKMQLEQVKQTPVGTIVELGEFAVEYMKWTPNQKAQWIVLKVTGNMALVISRDILHVQSFHNDARETNWKYSNLSSWLDREFYVNAFSDKEKEAFVRRQNDPEANPQYNTDNGMIASNYVFLLSAVEVEQYLTTPEARKAVATAFAQEQGADNSWLLRTMGKDRCHVTYVDSEGNIHYDGMPTTQPGGIRPAMWVDLMKVMEYEE